MSEYSEPVFPDAQNSESPDFMRDLISALNSWNLNLKSILDKGITFADNHDADIVSVTSHATPGTEFSVVHLLGKVPTGYIVCGQSAAGNVYAGSTANTKTALYLKSEAASVTFSLIVF